MFVVSGVGGKTGSSAAEALLSKGLPVRVIVRDAAKGEPWAERGAEVAVADLKNPTALENAFAGAAAAYVLNPPAYRASDMFAEAQAVADSVRKAVLASGLPKLVVLSSIGAGREGKLGAIGTNRILEQTLGTLPVSVTLLRAEFFMDNWINGLDAAREQGVLPSLMLPLDRAQPTVSTIDIGKTAADLMQEASTGRTVVELSGPRSYSPMDAAAAIAKVLGRPVTAVAVPEEQWPSVLTGLGFTPVTQAAYIEMMQSNNAGLFQPEAGVPQRRGSTTLEQAAASWLAV